MIAGRRVFYLNTVKRNLEKLSYVDYLGFRLSPVLLSQILVCSTPLVLHLLAYQLGQVSLNMGIV